MEGPSLGDEARGGARGRGLTGRPTYPEAAYVLAVAAMATTGFAVGSTATILIAVLVTLPAGLPALVGYYISYGLLALVPGANPDSSRWGTCSSNGHCLGSTTGDVAAWLTFSTGVIGALLLIVAAAVNVVVIRQVVSWRRSSGEAQVGRSL